MPKQDSSNTKPHPCILLFVENASRPERLQQHKAYLHCHGGTQLLNLYLGLPQLPENIANHILIAVCAHIHDEMFAEPSVKQLILSSEALLAVVHSFNSTSALPRFKYAHPAAYLVRIFVSQGLRSLTIGHSVFAGHSPLKEKDLMMQSIRHGFAMFFTYQ